MANFFVAGKADCINFARAERVADTMTRLLPTAVLTKFMIHPDDWDSFLSTKIRPVLGIDAPKTSPVVWDVSGRLIGGADEFVALASRRYGLELDVDEDALREIVFSNVEEATQRKTQQALKKKFTGRRALLIVDVQNDFLEGGSLEVHQANDAIPVINSVRAANKWDLVVLTQDWHPPNHMSFASNHEGAEPFEKRVLPDVGEQVMWPDHCVAGSIGADFHPYIDREDSDVVVRMGTNPKADSYSAFGDAFGGKYEKTELEDVLRAHAIDHVFVAGIALDFCVSFTARDARKCGFDTVVIEDASRGISDATIASEMELVKAAGAMVINAGDIPDFGAKAGDEAEFKRAETATMGTAKGNKRALIIVDVQNDFCEGGALEVPCGSEVVPVINRLREECKWDLIVRTMDSHPPDHASFASNYEGAKVHEMRALPTGANQHLWPDHCVQGSIGEMPHPDLDTSTADVVVRKGTDPRVDSYSGFGDEFQGKYEKTKLEALLKADHIRHVYIVGLATDYCVSFTAKDAATRGFSTTLIKDATRGLSAKVVAQEALEWARLGVQVCNAADVPASLD